MREAGPFRNVGDAGVQEAVLLEDLFRRREEDGPESRPLCGTGPLGFSLRVDTALSLCGLGSGHPRHVVGGAVFR